MILRLLGLFIVMGMMCMSDAEAKDDKKTIPEKAPAQEFSQAPSITKGTVTIKGKAIPYTATTGFMNITDDNGTVKATMFYVAYVRTDMASEKRPITFAFNMASHGRAWSKTSCIDR